MLNLIRKGAVTLAAIATLSATSVQAETHNVLVMEHAYYPAVTYVQPGDQIVFSNGSGIDHLVRAKNDSWTTGIIADGAEFTVIVEQGMQSAFTGVTLDDVVLEGNLNFSAPPLN